MTCDSEKCCSISPVCSTGYKMTEITKKSSKFFKPSILSSEIKFKTRFRPAGKVLELSVGHDHALKSTNWEMCAKGKINESFNLETKFFGTDKAHVKLLFNNPSITNIYAEMSGVACPGTGVVSPRIDVARRFKYGAILCAYTYKPNSECSKEGCCRFMSQSSVEVAGIVNYENTQAGVQVIVQNPTDPLKIDHLYAIKHVNGPFIVSFYSNSLKTLEGSLLYKHDSSLKLGVCAKKDAEEKSLLTLGFKKKVNLHTKVIGLVSSDFTASIALIHTFSDSLSFFCSTQFKVNNKEEPGKVGFGLELNA